MQTQESTPFLKNHQVEAAATTPFGTYEDIPMRYSSPVRESQSLHPFAQMSSPAKVGTRMAQLHKNDDFQPHTPQFQRPNNKVNLNIGHCQSEAQPRHSFHETLTAPENPFNIKVSSFDPEGELKPKLAPAPEFHARNRKYSMNENDFSNDIHTKVNENNGITGRDISPDR
jgi:hypothetical protein